MSHKYKMKKINEKNKIRKTKPTFGKAKAVFTIEAAFIVPIVMVIVVTQLFFAFYVHDKIILTSVSTYYVMENIDNCGGSQEAIENETKEMLSKRLLILKEATVSAEGNENKWVMKSSGTFQLPFQFIRIFFPGEDLQEKSEINISNLKGRKTLIKYKVVTDGIEKLTGEEKETTEHKG